jgi:hypothetical protein
MNFLWSSYEKNCYCIFHAYKKSQPFFLTKKSLALVIMTQQHSISLARNWNDGIKFIWKHLAWIFISGGKIYPKWGWPTSNSKRTCHGTSFFLSHLPLPFPKTKLPSPPLPPSAPASPLHHLSTLLRTDASVVWSGGHHHHATDQFAAFPDPPHTAGASPPGPGNPRARVLITATSLSLPPLPPAPKPTHLATS